MPVKVSCGECGAKFSIGDRQMSAPCPKCGTTKRKPKSPAGGKGVRCPNCKKTLPAGMTFCVACGVDAGGKDRGDSALAGWEMEEKSQRDIARWRMFAWLARLFRRM